MAALGVTATTPPLLWMEGRSQRLAGSLQMGRQGLSERLCGWRDLPAAHPPRHTVSLLPLPLDQGKATIVANDLCSSSHLLAL